MAVNPDFIKLMNNPVKFRMFLFAKLPSAYFSGLRIKSMDETHCTAAIPYKWFSQNPFRSTYFACLSMAAEMSTGSLAMANVYKRKPPVSMLVVKTEGTYYKKATGMTYFTCNDGQALTEHIDRAIATGEAVTFTAKSSGKNGEGELIAEFVITWSFKRKSNT
jgi:hypothetical protein